MLYDTLEELLAERIKEKVARGEARGEKQGENLFAALTSHLLDDNRFEELKKATKDIDYRQILYREYGIPAMVQEESTEYQVHVKSEKSED